MAGYTYDLLNRLWTDTDPTPLSFTYDANGNRKTGAGITYTYLPNTNRLATVAGQTITVSPNGNVLADPANGRTYTYNSANELAAVNQNDSPIANYDYDPQHRRISKTASDGYLLYHYDDAGHLLQETYGGGTLIRAYIWADDMPIAQITPNQYRRGVDVFTHRSPPYPPARHGHRGQGSVAVGGECLRRHLPERGCGWEWDEDHD